MRSWEGGVGIRKIVTICKKEQVWEEEQVHVRENEDEIEGEKERVGMQERRIKRMWERVSKKVQEALDRKKGTGTRRHEHMKEHKCVQQSMWERAKARKRLVCEKGREWLKVGVQEEESYWEGSRETECKNMWETVPSKREHENERTWATQRVSTRAQERVGSRKGKGVGKSERTIKRVCEIMGSSKSSQ